VLENEIVGNTGSTLFVDIVIAVDYIHSVYFSCWLVGKVGRFTEF